MSNDEVYVMHETQDSDLCGQHCLNNLVQQAVFNTVDLAEIAQELDRMEYDCLDEESRKTVSASGNVDNTGNFGISVLAAALMRSFDIDLVSWTSSEGREQQDPGNEQQGFIINQHSHWFTIRKIGGNWWNLDSVGDKPVYISPFYLEMYLSQLRQEGCMIFLAKGNVPPAGEYGYNPLDNPNAVWYAMSNLLPKRAGVSTATPSASVSASSSRTAVVAVVDDEEDEEAQLARAIAASLEH